MAEFVKAGLQGADGGQAMPHAAGGKRQVGVCALRAYQPVENACE
jgi:hypothetical protein